jgi:hypothetical protein
VYNRRGTRLWAVTVSGIAPYTLEIRNDGDLVILDSKRSVLWRTNTAGM